MNFPRPSLPDLAPAYPSQPDSQHVQYQNVPPAQQSFGPYRVDQTSVTSSTWQAQSFCGPAASSPGDVPFATGFVGNSQHTSTISTALAPPIHPQQRTRKRKAATLRAADWEPYKKRILDLHNVQNLPLNEVKQVMEEEYGFQAEPRQYQFRVSQWDKDKNIKPQEMQAIVRKRQKRKLIETHKPELVFEVRGNEVDRHKIERWMRRYNVSDSSLYAPSPAASTPSAVECYTERGSPTATTITMYSPLTSAPSPGRAVSTAHSPQICPTTLPLTNTLGSPLDRFREHIPILLSSPLHFQLNFIYSFDDSESVTDNGVHVYCKRDEEERLWGDLIIADLTTLCDNGEVQKMLLKLAGRLLEQGRSELLDKVYRTVAESAQSRIRRRDWIWRAAMALQKLDSHMLLPR